MPGLSCSSSCPDERPCPQAWYLSGWSLEEDVWADACCQRPLTQFN